MKITLKVEGVEDVRRALQRAGSLIRMAMIGLVSETALGIQRDAKENAPVDTGRTRASIQTAAWEGGLSQEVWVGAESGLYQDRGTGTENLDGPRPRHHPPSDALKRWCARHGLRGLEYVIARAIYKRGGLRPRPFFTPAVEKYEKGYSQEAARILRKAIEEA